MSLPVRKAPDEAALSRLLKPACSRNAYYSGWFTSQRFSADDKKDYEGRVCSNKDDWRKSIDQVNFCQGSQGQDPGYGVHHIE